MGTCLYRELPLILNEIINISDYVVLETAKNKEIIIMSDEKGYPGIWLLDIDNGTKNRLTHKPVSLVARPLYMTDKILFTRDVSYGKELQILFQVDLEGNEEVYTNMKPMRITSLVFDGNKAAFIAHDQGEVSLYIANEKEIFKLREMPSHSILTDIRGNYVVGYGVYRDHSFTIDTFLIDLLSGQLKLITPPSLTSINRNPIFDSKNRIIFETSAFEEKRILVAYDLLTETISPLEFEGKDYEKFPSTEYYLYKNIMDRWIIVGKKEGVSHIYIDGYELQIPRGTVTGATLLDDRIILSMSSFDSPPHILEIKTNKTYRNIIENPISEPLRKAFGKTEFIYIESFDKTKIPIFIIESGLAKKPAPTVIYLHKGPLTEVTNSWNTLIASLLFSGYNVVIINYRGSSGYGEKYIKLVIGNPIEAELLDILEVSKYMINKGMASQLSIIGHGYGGYLTIMALIFSDLFTSGVACSSITDWKDFYELSEKTTKKLIETLFGVDLPNEREKSPITNVNKINKPLCLIHAANDYESPLVPILKFISELAMKNKIFEAHIYPGTENTLNSKDGKIKIITTSLIFLKKCIGGDK